MISDKDFPRVTLVVATHNEKAYIHSCLSSIMSLDWPKERLEIIIADSSTDGTDEIVRRFSSIKLIRSETPNVATKRNKAIKEARGKLIAITDGDCTVPSHWLKSITAVLLKKRIVAACGDALPPPRSSYFGRCVAALGIPAGGSLGLGAAITIKHKDRINRIVTCNSIFRRQVFDDVGFFDESMPFASDTDLSMRIAAAGREMVYARGSYVYHAPRKSFLPFIKWNIRRGIELMRLKTKWPMKISTWQYWLHGILFVAVPISITLAAITLDKYGMLLAIAGTISLMIFVMCISDTRYALTLIKRWRNTDLGLASVIFILPLLSFIQYCSRAAGFLWASINLKQTRH